MIDGGAGGGVKMVLSRLLMGVDGGVGVMRFVEDVYREGSPGFVGCLPSFFNEE
jgi:hypothetical protein